MEGDHGGWLPRSSIVHAPNVFDESLGPGNTFESSSKSSSNSSFSRSTNLLKNAGKTPPFPPLPPLPPSPPKFDSRISPRSQTPPLPSLSQEIPTPLTPPPEDDDRNYRDTSSKSRASKQPSKSLPRRLLDEIEHLQHHGKHHTNSTSPVNSYPGRHRHERSHSRTRSSSDTMSSLLAVTTERLSYETARANDAERQSAEIMALFKKTHEAKARTERDLLRVREELGLYKIQLDVAQKEIFRAQEIVERLERERMAAEEESARARDKIHKLNEVRAVERALDEGRRMGFKEGLKQGRMMQSAIIEDDTFRSRPVRRGERDRVSRYTYPEEESNISSSDGSSESSMTKIHSAYPQGPDSAHPAHREPPNLRPRRESSAARPLPPPPLAHPHGTPPDVGRYSELLPRLTVTTPIPVENPSTQPQTAPPMPPHQPPNPIHDHSKKPEMIDVQPSRDSNGPIHPIPVWNRSPSVKHERIVLPPDNYIPIMDANSVISLPPPHEMSMLVAPEAPSLPPPEPLFIRRPRSTSRAADHPENAKDYPGRQKDPAGRVYHNPNRRRGDDSASVAYTARSDGTDRRKYTMPPHGTSFVSQNSTRISELDLLSSPQSENNLKGKGRYREEAEPSNIRRPVRPKLHLSQPPTERIAEEWRTANKEYLRPISPPDSRAGSSKDTHRGEPINPIPPSSLGTQYVAPSRRPREIVLPAPLAEVMMNTPTRPTSNLPTSGGLSISTHPQSFRTTSAATVPGIEVVTPSTHASTQSVRTILDPVLLTPESANRPVPLPSETHESHEESGLGLYYQTNVDDEQRNSLVLPDNNLPAGFVPLSPIPGMANLNPYPPGFAPNIPKNHPSMSSNFTYPSSPLIRPMDNMLG